MRIRAGAISIALALLFACAADAGARAGDPRDTPLLDQRGNAFTIGALAGKPLLLTFVASRCSDACPIADAMFDRIYMRLRRERIDARLLTVTLDPDYDTPFVMAGFAHEFDPDAGVWRFASGKPADVRRLMRAFGIVTQTGRDGVPDVHSTFVYVLDRHMRRSDAFLLSTNLPQQAIDALRRQ